MALENLKEGNLKKLLQKHSGCEQSSSEARERVDELVTEFLVKIAEAAGKSAEANGLVRLMPENIDEMARVAAHTSIPIATGERLVTKYEFAQVLKKQAAQILQLDVGQCGGITEAKKIASMAEAHYAMIAPHMYCGPVAAAAAIQIDTCSPNFLIQEANQGPLHKKIFKEPLVFENGFIVPPTGPGLGVEFDEDVLNAHLVS